MLLNNIEGSDRILKACDQSSTAGSLSYKWGGRKAIPVDGASWDYGRKRDYGILEMAGLSIMAVHKSDFQQVKIFTIVAVEWII